MMKKIIVLGSKGMLGQMVTSYFSRNYQVVEINSRYSLSGRYDFLDEIKKAGDGYIINCIGRIKQKTENIESLVSINSTLPIDIYNSLTDNQYLIHPSTDCVFDGKTEKEWYSVKEPPNAMDDYGWSKRLGEVGLIGKERAYIIRVSIIGPDKISEKPKGLLGWFLSNESKSTLNGYKNHLWNGITTLEWCKKVEELILEKDSSKMKGCVVQLGTKQRYSKYDMLNLFQQAFKSDYLIHSFETAKGVNRCLQPDVFSSPLEQQLEEVVNFEL